jgi:hypothetical protein
MGTILRYEMGWEYGVLANSDVFFLSSSDILLCLHRDLRLGAESAVGVAPSLSSTPSVTPIARPPPIITIPKRWTEHSTAAIASLLIFAL